MRELERAALLASVLTMTKLVHADFNRAVVRNGIHLDRTNESPSNIGAFGEGAPEPHHHLCPRLKSPRVVVELEIGREVAAELVSIVRIVCGEDAGVGTFDLVSKRGRRYRRCPLARERGRTGDAGNEAERGE